MKIQIGLICAFLLTLGLSLQSAEKEHVKMDVKHQQFLKDNCLKCHNEKKSKGKFRVDNLSFAFDSNKTAGQWQKVLNSLNSGEMPPEGKKQPGPKEKADFLDALANTMVKARKSLSDQGGAITMRRLNRREYGNSLRELIGVNINVTELPGDSAGGGFDTVGANLFMSSNQIEQYLSLGREALDEAFEWQKKQDFSEKKRFEAEYLSEKYKKYVELIIDKKARAEKWVKAFNEVSAKPENKEILAKLKKKYKSDAHVRRQWAQIKGAPAPEEFGFKTKENNADKANSALKPYYLAYFQHYLKQPKIDKGAYLTVPTVHPSQLPTGYLQFINPWSWPPGDYVVRIRAGAVKGAPFERRLLEFGVNAAHGQVMSTHEVTGTIEEPQIIEIPITFTKKHTDRESRQIFIREKASDYYISNPRRTFNKHKEKNGIGPEFVLWIDWLEIQRIPNKDQGKAPGLKAISVPLDDKSKDIDKGKLKSTFANFAKQAFRGNSVPSTYVDKLLNIYELRRKNGAKHSDALKYTLSVVLSSPMFLYLAEPLKGTKSRRLKGEELATRLAFFLWGAPADARLLALGKSGKLFNRKTLISETNRLLNDPRSKDFVHSFTYQWLGLDRIDFFEPDIKKFQTFDDSVKKAVKDEVYETVSHILAKNYSLKDLLKADYAVINNVLGSFYGIDGVVGDHFREVKLPKNSPRGGLLGMSAIHIMGGNGHESSPVERGVWVLRKLLNNPPPPAPANVPLISRLDTKPLTTKERLVAHQELPQCKSCHRKIDPIGFGLENFDAVGLWREEDHFTPIGKNGKPDKKNTKSWKIDPSGKMHKGASFKNYFELRDIISSKITDFSKGYSTALVEYALGRPAGISDEKLIQTMVSKSRNYAMRDFIILLVISKQFQTK